LVFWATALTSAAPMFSNGSGRSISLETVTPSLVTVGPPNDLSMMTFRPVGPRVMPTAWTSFSAPASSFLRASSVYSSCFAISVCSPEDFAFAWRTGCVSRRVLLVPRLHPAAHAAGSPSPAVLAQLGQDVRLAHDFKFLAVHFDFIARILAVENDIAFLH